MDLDYSFVLTSKLPTNLPALFAQIFYDRVWELNELLILLKTNLKLRRDH